MLGDAIINQAVVDCRRFLPWVIAARIARDPEDSHLKASASRLAR